MASKDSGDIGVIVIILLGVTLCLVAMGYFFNQHSYVIPHPPTSSESR